MKKKKGLLECVPAPFLDAFVHEGVIPFVGAGFSKNCNGPAGFEMPDWSQLGRAVASELRDCSRDLSELEMMSVHALSQIGCKTFRPTIATDDATPGIRAAAANWRNS